MALSALSIGAFTPISKEANYKPDLPLITNAISESSSSSSFSAPSKIQMPVAAVKNSPPESRPVDKPQHITLEQAPDSDNLISSIGNPPAKKAAPTNSPTKTSTVTSAGSIAFVVEKLPTMNLVSTTSNSPESQIAKTSDEMPDFESNILFAFPSFRDLNGDDIASIEPEADMREVKTFTIQSGDTLTRIFSRAGLAISQAIKLSQDENAKKLNRLSIGKTLRIYYGENQQFQTLEYDINKLNTLVANIQNGQFDVITREKQVEYRTFTAQGIIDSSLGLAVGASGMPVSLTSNLMDIYQWEIDFARDLKKGDRFSVVYQKAFIGDEYIANGEILGASFTTGSRTIDAIRYTDSNGVTAYFQPNGDSLKRGFLRSPVKTARITSKFGRRFHPIKKIWKEHRGVDYGAKRGTPVFATADGVIQYAGKKGGYGNAVILRHGGTYTTLYAHMSKIGKGIRTGKSVSQGQIVGYVGQSGWATGNHLHYEFRINGEFKDPLGVDLPRTLPLASKEMKNFNTLATRTLASLSSIRGRSVAKLDANSQHRAL